MKKRKKKKGKRSRFCIQGFEICNVERSLKGGKRKQKTKNLRSNRFEKKNGGEALRILRSGFSNIEFMVT